MSDVKNKVLQLVNTGNFAKARKVCLSICKSEPKNAEMWFMLSAICGHQNDFKAAEQYISKAIKLNPGVSAAHYNLAIARRRLGQSERALESLNKALNLQPEFSPALYEMANIYMEMDECSRAIELYNEAVAHATDAYQAYTALGQAYSRTGQVDAAEKAYNRSLSINSSQVEAYIGLATLHEKSGDISGAINCIILAENNGFSGINVSLELARLYSLNGDLSKAENQYLTIISDCQTNKRALAGLALLYEQQHRYAAALEYIEKAATIGNHDEYFYYNYGKILTSSNKFVDAEAAYTKALDTKPDFVEAMINLGNIYLLSGKPDNAYKIYSRAYEASPTNSDASSNMLMSLNYISNTTESEIIDKHVEWALQVDKIVRRVDLSKRLENKKLRIGYVSPDFRKHSVSYFFDALLRSSTDNVENYCYSDVKHKDSVTETLMEMANSWLDVSKMTDKELADRVVEDNIDILIDLCGHMAGNRMAMFAMKPAPIQMSYLGYPNTTGLATMDFRLVDHYTDPVGVADIPEERLYLDPSFICYRPINNCPDVSPLPALSKGYITFGSFNNLAKISSNVIELWSKILLSVPKSKLCVKARQYSDQGVIREHIDMFKSYGINQGRLEFIAYSNTIQEHLECYSRVDIALDTFPYNGTTTTCEALWMGVPVVAIKGNMHASRVSASILTNVGKPEWIANSDIEYLNVALSLVQSIDVLNSIRQSLRKTMRSSVLCDGESFARKFEIILQTAASGL